MLWFQNQQIYCVHGESHEKEWSRAERTKTEDPQDMVQWGKLLVA